MAQSPESPHKRHRDRSHDLQTVLMVLAVSLLTWFVVSNTEKVRVQFWVVTINVRLIVVILVSAVLGALSALLVSAASRRRAAKRVK